jgi:hypothetical protein
MAKDLLLNIDVGDIQLEKGLSADNLCFTSKWGNILDGDNDGVLYLNIIIPSMYQNSLRYDENDIFECNFKATYCPDTRYFFIRFLIDNNGIYQNLDSSIIPIPNILSVKTYKNGSCELTDIGACQLPIININGEFKIVTRKTDNIIAELYSMSSSDIDFGNSSDQSAKLLSLCAPGKNYRFPLSGVGITDYINSVVANSDLAEKLAKEFENNNTPISSAEFDPDTGDLKITQSADLEEDISGNIEDLDLDIVLNASDEFIRETLKLTEDVSPEDIFKEFADLENIYGIFTLGSVSMDIVNDNTLNDKTFSFYNESNKSYFKGYDAPNYVVVSGMLYPGDLIMLNGFRWEAQSQNQESGEVISVNTPFVLTAEDQEFDGTLIKDESLYSKVSVQVFDTRYDECGIVLKKCKVFYTLHAQELESKSRGVFRLNVNNDVVKDMLCLVHDPITGRLLAHISSNSNIQSVSLDQQRGRLLINKT